MGVASLYGSINPYSSFASGLGNKVQSYLRRQIIKVESGKYHYQTDLKILKVINKIDIPISRDDAILEMNRDISLGNSYFTNTNNVSHVYYGYYGRIYHASRHAESNVKLTYEEISPLEAIELFSEANMRSDFGVLVIEDSKGERSLIDFPYSNNAAYTINSFHICQIDMSKSSECRIKLVGERNWTNRGRGPLLDISNFTKFYKIIKHVRTETYI